MSCPNPCPLSCSQCNYSEACPSSTVCYSCLNPLTPANNNPIQCADCLPEFINRALEFSILLNHNMSGVYADENNNVTYVPLLAYALYQSTLEFTTYLSTDSTIKGQDVNLSLLYFDYVGNASTSPPTPNLLAQAVFSGVNSLDPLIDPPSNSVFHDFIDFFQAPAGTDARASLINDYNYMLSPDSNDGFYPSVEAIINNSNSSAGAVEIENNLASLYCNLGYFAQGNSSNGIIGAISAAINSFIASVSIDYANGTGDAYLGALHQFLYASPTDLPGSSKLSTPGIGGLYALSSAGSLGLLGSLITTMNLPNTTMLNTFRGLVDIVYKGKYGGASYICPVAPSNGDVDNSIGFSHRANELALLFYQQDYFAPVIDKSNPGGNFGLGCWALCESFRNMNDYMGYLGTIDRVSSPNAYSLNTDINLPINVGDNTYIIPASVPMDPVSVGTLCLQMIEKPGGLNDMVGVFQNLFGFSPPAPGSSSVPNSGPQVNNCFKDCQNSAAYTAIANLIQDMTGYVSDPTNQTKLTAIAGHILAFNAITGLTDGYLTALTLYINALPAAGTPKVPSLSLAQASTGPINFTVLDALISTTITLKDGKTIVNVFLALLQNIMTLEFGQNAGGASCIQSTSVCKAAYNGCTNVPTSKTYNQCNDGTCCAASCVGSTCCSIDPQNNPLGLPNPNNGSCS
jgi:hypothetical protein